MATEVTGTGNLVTVRTPKFLSVVGLPANKRAFSVVRSEPQPTTGEPSMKPSIVRRQRRSDASPILRVTFPSTYTDAQVTETMQTYKLAGYDVVRAESGEVLATRSDLKSISTEGTAEILLTSDGIKATVQRVDAPAGDNPKSAVSVASLVFRAESFNESTVMQWLRDKGVEATMDSAGAGDYIVKRRDVEEGEETRVVELEPGVQAVVVRSDTMDVPDGYVALVNEACYGNWGWGQLDFAASMADVEFSRAMDDAVYRLRHVLDQILLYSALPLADRKTLMVNALEQFKAFTVGILDSLPRTVLVAVARSASPTLEKPDMTMNAAGGATTPATQTAPAQPATLTRADVAAAVAEVLPALLTEALGKFNTTQTRSEGGEDTKPATGTPAAGGSTQEGQTAITRADLTAAVAEAVKPLVERVEKVEGGTVVRSDTGDASVTQTTVKQDTGKPKDVFRGSPVFGGLGLKRGG